MVERPRGDAYLGFSCSEAKEKPLYKSTAGVVLPFSAVDRYAGQRNVLQDGGQIRTDHSDRAIEILLAASYHWYQKRFNRRTDEHCYNLLVS